LDNARKNVALQVNNELLLTYWNIGRIIVSYFLSAIKINVVFMKKRQIMQGGLFGNIFASRYVLYMPNKEQLIRQVETVLEKWNKDDLAIKRE